MKRDFLNDGYRSINAHLDSVRIVNENYKTRRVNLLVNGEKKERNGEGDTSRRDVNCENRDDADCANTLLITYTHNCLSICKDIDEIRRAFSN